MSRWRNESFRIISKTLREGKAAGETGQALRDRIDAAYPFGERAMLPYKMWLEARRQIFDQEGLMTEAERAKNRDRKFHRDGGTDWDAARESGLIQ